MGSLVDESDLTKVNVFFHDVPIERVETYLMNPENLNEPFYIPANQVSFHGSFYVSNDVSLISTIPHSHLLGKSWYSYATSADNQDTIQLYLSLTGTSTGRGFSLTQH